MIHETPVKGREQRATEKSAADVTLEPLLAINNDMSVKVMMNVN